MEVIETWTALNLVVKVCLEMTTGQHGVCQAGQVDADYGEGISETQDMSESVKAIVMQWT